MIVIKHNTCESFYNAWIDAKKKRLERIPCDGAIDIDIGFIVNEIETHHYIMLKDYRETKTNKMTWEYGTFGKTSYIETKILYILNVIQKYTKKFTIYIGNRKYR